MYNFLQQIINGLTLGSIYALIAIGYTMVYGIIGLINFAHGEIYMIGAYVGVVSLVGLPAFGLPLTLVIILAILIAVVLTGGYGFAVEKIAYKPLRNSPRLVPLISAIGMSIFLQNFVALGQSNKDIALQPVLTARWELLANDHGMSVSLSALQIIIFVVTLAAMLALNLFIKKSKTGMACRACASDIGMAKLLGIDADKIIALTFVIGAALAAIGMKAFTAAVLGGIGSIPGAMLGGFILGLSESFASAYLASEYKDLVAFSLLIVVLLIRPSGILGKPEVEKV